MLQGASDKPLARRVNPRKLAYAGSSISGVVDPALLENLHDAGDCEGVIFVNLEFFIGDEGKMRVGGKVAASMVFQCQRCLNLMPASIVEATVNVAVVKDEEQAKQLPKNIDPWLVEGDEVDLYGYIEEELLLAIPAVSYHDYDCIDKTVLSAGEVEDSHSESGASAGENPFSVLAKLKEDKS